MENNAKSYFKGSLRLTLRNAKPSLASVIIAIIIVGTLSLNATMDKKFLPDAITNFFMPK